MSSPLLMSSFSPLSAAAAVVCSGGGGGGGGAPPVVCIVKALRIKIATLVWLRLPQGVLEPGQPACKRKTCVCETSTNNF
jgi:hypothetical protein